MSWLLGGGAGALNSASGNDTTENKTNSALPTSFDGGLRIDEIIGQPGTLDTARLHPLAGLERGVEFLDLEEEQLSNVEGAQGLIPSRGWTDDLCYGTGAVYLTGLGMGGISGFVQGVRAIPEGAPGKLQLNTILNHITRRGPFLGNNAGILALSYNMVNSAIDAMRGKHDAAGSVLAGALTGAIFRSSRGFKPMAIAAGLMASAAGAWSAAKTTILQSN